MGATTPFIGALQWLSTKKGIEAGVGVLGGRAVAEITTALGHEYLFTTAQPGDLLPNVVGDLAGAAVAWELGKAVSPNIAAFAAASAATRFLQTKVTEMVTNPIMEKAAPKYYASMAMQPRSAPNGTAPLPEEGGATEGLYGLGQVRMDDAVALSQVRVPDYPDMEGMGSGMSEDSLFG
jgi:hypothetical protein